MIVIIAAMSEEIEAIKKVMDDIKITHFFKMNYHGTQIDNKVYKGKLSNQDVALVHCGVGKVYAALVTTMCIQKFKPELVINVGCAGSLNKDVHVGDCVVATRVASWDVDVPETDWKRSIYNDKMSFVCDGHFVKCCDAIANKYNIKKGHIVSSEQFIYKKSQVSTIKKYFDDALCGEMEGSAIANTCYAFGIKVAILRTISDETLVNGDYHNFDFNLKLACNNAAKICKEIIKRY